MQTKDATEVLAEVRRHLMAITGHRDGIGYTEDGEPCPHYTGTGCEASMVNHADDALRLLNVIAPANGG